MPKNKYSGKILIVKLTPSNQIAAKFIRQSKATSRLTVEVLEHAHGYTPGQQINDIPPYDVNIHSDILKDKKEDIKIKSSNETPEYYFLTLAKQMKAAGIDDMARVTIQTEESEPAVITEVQDGPGYGRRRVRVFQQNKEMTRLQLSSKIFN